jgi:dCTP diphosphatase
VGRLEALDASLSAFVEERDWNQFHTPKNLAMALTVEAAELQELFQWLTEAESRALPKDTTEAVRDELADVFIYTLRMSQVLGVDLLEAAFAKLEKNKQKYPVDKARGSMKKYDKL